MICITLQQIYVIVTTSIKHFFAFVYFENIFLKCLLELTMIMLRMSVNYTNDDALFVWMIDFNPKIFTRRHKNVEIVTTEPSDERNLSPGFIQLRTPARINICSATRQPPGMKLETISHRRAIQTTRQSNAIQRAA